MLPVRLALLFAALNAVAPAGGPLRVLRVTPTTPASPDAAVTVTFDRPVAGGLDATVDARAIFSITPAVPGTIEWRDPVTLRFTPAAPLTPGASYRIRIAPDFQAMDGSRLAGAYEATFRVSPPRVLGGEPANPHRAARYLPATPTFALLVSAPVDRALVERMSSIRLAESCGGGSVAVRVSAERQLSEADPRYFTYLGYDGPYPRDPARDLRRIVELKPATPLPLACAGELSLPPEFDPGVRARVEWRFHTYDPLRLLQVGCGYGGSCPTGPVRIEFSTPVRGAEVLRRVRIAPEVPFTVSDTTAEQASWTLDAQLAPRQRYAVVVDSALTDIFGQRLGQVAVRALASTGYEPSVSYEYGKLLVEREGLRTLAVQHVNVDTLEVTVAPVPDSMIQAFLGRGWGWDEPWQALVRAGAATSRAVPVPHATDERRVTGVPLLPLAAEPAGASGAGQAAGAGNAPLAGAPRGAPRGTLLAVTISSPQLDSLARRHLPIALVQITDLAVHARVGTDQAVVWVTGVEDGLPRAGAAVTLYDAEHRVRASGRTDREGLVRLDRLTSFPKECQDWSCSDFEGYVIATLGEDRAIVGINAYDPDLSPWRFNVSSAWGTQREPAAAAVFTERGIYRPGEPLYAKAIVRAGALGALHTPAPGDSLHWIFNDREGGVLQELTVALSEFGTADQRLELPRELPLGQYQVQAQTRWEGEWRTLASAYYQVAEYRPPEFLVDVVADATPRLAGDTADAQIAARYLFGAPMAHAPVRWALRQQPLQPWELEIPGAESYQIGRGYSWWDDDGGEGGVRITAEGADTLDATGRLDLRLPLPAPTGGRAARVSILANVTDANRQTVASGASLTVHPAAFYIGAKVRGSDYFWRAGVPVSVEVIAVRPEGARLAGVEISGVLVRREWHRVRRNRGGYLQEVGAWVQDTVATCSVRSRVEPVGCDFTPPRGGSYTLTLSATDPAGRTATTTLSRWAAGPGWIPWNDETQLKLDLVLDRERYAVGDTATVLFASPFTDAEAWVTVERERVIESRRIRIEDGATTLRFPITEAYAPNAFVSVVVVRGRSAPPGPLDDPGRPALRVGYAELRVTPEVKRLAVEVAPLRPEYRPGDSASVRIRVRSAAGQGAAGQGARAEVTLWAVDEGVLALTGYQTPDPIDLLYPPRGVGLRLASNLTAVAAQVPDGQKGKREPGGGGGEDLTAILRSRFQTTAFFLGSVVTDETGEAVARAKLPDNLTTFRVMAVAVTTGDRYGRGQSDLLVTRPLVARPALPRFVREGDEFSAGVVVNTRLGGTPRVKVEAKAEGVRLTGPKSRNETLRGGRGVESRFEFQVPLGAGRSGGTPGDSARFQFRASSGKEADAVAVAIPVRPSYAPLAQTVAGLLRDTASAVFTLQDDVDAARSTLEISFGASPLAFLRGASRTLHVYPYVCTEQLTSIALPLIALYRAAQEFGAPELAPPGAAKEIEATIATILRRQRPDGGIGFWSVSDWSTPWLSAYAGRVLLEARAAGFTVPDTALARLAGYLDRSLRQPLRPEGGITRWFGSVQSELAERVAAVDFLSRLGRPDIAAENMLLSQAGRLHWEDRVLLAEVLARRGQRGEAVWLLEHATAAVRVEGRVAVLPEMAAGRHYFTSKIRPAARLLDALLVVEPGSPLIGPVVEGLVEQGRAGLAGVWNTQDYGYAALALTHYEEKRRAAGTTRVRITSGGKTLADATVGATAPETLTIPLQGLVTRDAEGRPLLRLDLQGEGGAPSFYYLTVREAPRGVQLTPIERGIQVERWYEDPQTGQPIVTTREGELVRVRLRVTVPVERNFVVLDDPLPAGLEAVDLSLRTVSPFGGREEDVVALASGTGAGEDGGGWSYGRWDAGLWSPFDHKELRDDRVIYSATVLWKGSYTATYLARATTAGTFLYPPAQAEEMYNPGVNGRSGGGEFRVTK
jgi:uncharacterized protein YfaS (alpha-2-macroglobulin family)